MNVSSESDVIGQVIAVVVGIFVDHEVVAIPKPVVAVTHIKVRNAEVEAAEPKPAGTAAGQMPNMAASESACEVAVLPGMIEVVVAIVAAGVVADPLAVAVNVRHVGMARFVVEVSVFFYWMRRPRRAGAVGWDVPATFMVLRERRKEKRGNRV